MINRVLTVCTGNICRSPLAEALLRQHLPGLQVGSAGVGALVGRPAEPHALTIAEADGLDLTSHRARQIDSAIVAESDLILVMEQGQAEWINQVFPQARGRVFLLGRWDEEAEVPDPYRQSLEQFQAVYAHIQAYSQSWCTRLQQMNPSHDHATS